MAGLTQSTMTFSGNFTRDDAQKIIDQGKNKAGKPPKGCQLPQLFYINEYITLYLYSQPCKQVRNSTRKFRNILSTFT